MEVDTRTAAKQSDVEAFERGRTTSCSKKLVTLVTGSWYAPPKFASSLEEQHQVVTSLSQDDIRKGLHPTDQNSRAFYERNKVR
jgi:hypothetical protein